MMIRLTLFVTLVVLALGHEHGGHIRRPITPAFRRDLTEHWERFKKTFEKHYTAEEEIVRRVAFEHNIRVITKHNLEFDLGVHTFRLGLNKYADLMNDEFRQRMNGYRRSNRTLTSRHTYLPSSNIAIPDSVDWRKEGYVTGIKDQAQCGSCWAFSATGSLEGQHFKATNKLVSLSEQNLVDCSGPEGNEGCEGGLMDQAFEYVLKNGGIDTEDSYPYTAEDGTCKFNANSIGATLTGYSDIPSGDENALTTAAATIGPISVAIDASSIFFQLYSGGVYYDIFCSTDNLDHGVLVVGYGTTSDGKDYYIVKNSWGSSWGEDGYIRMSRNRNNNCGIATQASYPLI